MNGNGNNNPLSKWIMGLVGTGVVAAATGIITLYGRVAGLEGREQEIIPALRRIEDRMDRLLENQKRERQ